MFENLDFETLVQFLSEKQAKFYTYQLKEDKPIRVVIRNLHLATPTELIKSELEQRIFEVNQVSIVLHKIKKHLLPLFFVELEQNHQYNDIFQLTSLLYTKINVEEPYKHNNIGQSTNLQVYRHTKSYFGMCGSLRCSLCTGLLPEFQGYPTQVCSLLWYSHLKLQMFHLQISPTTKSSKIK